MFTRCQKGDVSGGVSKSFLLRYFGGNVTAVLNDGRCSINETDKLYYFRLTGAPSLCGGQTLVSPAAGSGPGLDSHPEFYTCCFKGGVSPKYLDEFRTYVADAFWEFPPSRDAAIASIYGSLSSDDECYPSPISPLFLSPYPPSPRWGPIVLNALSSVASAKSFRQAPELFNG